MQLGQLEERDRELPNDLSQPLPYCDANYLNRKGLTRGGIVDGSGTTEANELTNVEGQTQTEQTFGNIAAGNDE